MPQENQLNTHILFVDGVRVLAALYVAVHHAVLQTYKLNNINTIRGFKNTIYSAAADATPVLTHKVSDVLFGLCSFCLLIMRAKRNRKGNFSYLAAIEKQVHRLLNVITMALIRIMALDTTRQHQPTLLCILRYGLLQLNVCKNTSLPGHLTLYASATQ